MLNTWGRCAYLLGTGTGLIQVVANTIHNVGDVVLML